jgi:putative cell wall-binding protein
MKKIILVIFVFAVAIFSMPALSAQENQDSELKTVTVVDDYVQVDVKDLPVNTRLLVIEVFKDFEIKMIYQHKETKLLKVVALKDDEEMTFIQKENGNFVEQE